jgi:hypothetical protein
MNPPLPPHRLDYQPLEKSKSPGLRVLRRWTLAFCWIWIGILLLCAIVAISLRKDPMSSIHSDLLDWRDVTRTVSRDVFLAIPFMIIALLLRPKRPKKKLDEAEDRSVP